jgi:hypothetical protein
LSPYKQIKNDCGKKKKKKKKKKRKHQSDQHMSSVS